MKRTPTSSSTHSSINEAATPLRSALWAWALRDKTTGLFIFYFFTGMLCCIRAPEYTCCTYVNQIPHLVHQGWEIIHKVPIMAVSVYNSKDSPVTAIFVFMLSSLHSSNSELNEFTDATQSQRIEGQHKPDWRQGHNDSPQWFQQPALISHCEWSGGKLKGSTVWCNWLVGISSVGPIKVLNWTYGLPFVWCHLLGYSRSVCANIF